MMPKAVAVILLLVFFSITAKGQDTSSAQHAFYLEIGKSALFGNVVYDRKRTDKKFGFRFFAGLSQTKYILGSTIGAGIYRLIGKDRKILELGTDVAYLHTGRMNAFLGSPLVYPNYPTDTYAVSALVGYRSYGKKFLFRTGLAPTILKNDSYIGGYISLGFVLKKDHNKRSK